jgi:hypothetical protein
MDSLLQLHLQNDNPKPEAENLSKPKDEAEELKPLATSKRLNKIINRAAHKGASQYGRNSSGIFTK